MDLFSKNKDFYPTPSRLFFDMWFKIPEKDRDAAKYILEPEAGAGDIIEQIKKNHRYHRNTTIHAIEKDPNLISILRGKDITVIDYDFLNYSGSDKYDIIIGNPPFSEGDKHLLKAIDIMYSGHIVFLLNAETIKNPCTNTRKMLAETLDKLNADIDYKSGAFSFAERHTPVEVAIIHIHIKRDIKTDLFDGIEQIPEEKINFGEAHRQSELVEKDSIRNLVAKYNRAVKIGTQTMLDFYKNYHHVSGYMDLVVNDGDAKDSKELTQKMNGTLNDFLKTIRKDYWKQVLLLEKVKDRMTVKKRLEFEKAIQDNAFMDFTENNIRQFILNLINGYEDILLDATIELFETMTTKHSWHEDLHTTNVHYFNGWKTNKAYYVNKKVIIPFNDRAFVSFFGDRWEVDWQVKEKLNDIDKVMNYFDGRSKYTSIVDALETGFADWETRGIKSTYFTISVYKKGTCHLTFNDDDILRRFNVSACKGKEWLPHDYGNKNYSDMTAKERGVVREFEGEASYKKNVVAPGKSLFKTKELLQIAMVSGEKGKEQAA